MGRAGLPSAHSPARPLCPRWVGRVGRSRQGYWGEAGTLALAARLGTGTLALLRGLQALPREAPNPLALGRMPWLP